MMTRIIFRLTILVALVQVKYYLVVMINFSTLKKVK